MTQEKPEALETPVEQARRVRKGILVRQVQQGIQGLTEIRVAQDRLAIADQQDRQVIQDQRELRVLTARLEAQVSQARREILAIRDPSGARETPVPPGTQARQE